MNTDTSALGTLVKKVSCEDDVYPVCNTSDPSHPTGVEPITSFWFLVRPPVVQKVDSAMRGINLCPMYNDIVPPNTYPLGIYLSGGLSTF